MTQYRWTEVERLYHAASELEPAERIAFLHRSCTDEQLRREVESLLAHIQEGDALLENLPSQSRPVLSIGTRLGPYEITSTLGSGGMGDVYQALDARLDRKVAIKVCASQFSERFEREAHAIASLNHPHVCTLYDVGPNYLVMELLEGETLAARLDKGPLPLEKILQYGVEIADALAAAHARGIIHRDLKPVNIMLTPTGVKVLDFGVAKLARPDNGSRQSEKLTGEHSIPGTPAYMAPEQLAGRECDTRSDIYALGLVLYEMLTGQQPLETGVDPENLEDETVLLPRPGGALLAPIIRKCLAKNPEQRWQSARDLKTNLEWAHRYPRSRWRRKTRRAALVLGSAAATLAVVALIGWLTQSKNDVPHAHFAMSPPEGTRLASRIPTKALVSVAPDGKKFVVVAEDDSGVRALWLRHLSSTAYQRLDQTDGATLAFWSPDSKFIAFFAEGKLKKVPQSGGLPQVICDIGLGDGEGGTWSRDGVIVFAPPRPAPAALPTGALYRVLAAGGKAQPATTLDRADGELSHSWPQFLPDGRHFLYLARNEKPEKSRVYVQKLGSPESRRMLLESKTQAIHAIGPGGRSHLLFLRDAVLLAQPLDLGRVELFGEPVPLALKVSHNTLYGTAAFTVSDNGVVAYRSGIISSSTNPIRKLAWYTRQGQRIAEIGDPGWFRSMALSPDERRVAVDRQVSPTDYTAWDVWIIELATGIFSRLTLGPDFRSPVWAPDSRRIAAISETGNRKDLVEIALASPEPAVLHSDRDLKLLQSWTPDGRHLLFTAGPAAFRLPLFGARKPQPILNSSVHHGRLMVSPDGHWIAYQSSESGRNEVYVRSFPALDQKRQVSNRSGSQPLWRKDGRELFYLTLNGTLMAVNVKPGATLETSTPKALFQSSVEGNPALGQYAVTGDGQRFLLMEPVREGAGPGVEQFYIELNWFSELMAKDTGTK